MTSALEGSPQKSRRSMEGGKGIGVTMEMGGGGSKNSTIVWPLYLVGRLNGGGVGINFAKGGAAAPSDSPLQKVSEARMTNGLS